MYRLFVKIKYLPLLSTINLTSVEFIDILTTLCHLPISLVLFPHSLVDALEYAQVGLNYTKFLFLKQMFIKNGYPKNFTNISKDLWITHT